MSQKTDTAKSPDTAQPADPFAKMRHESFANMMGMSTAWMEAMSDMSAEVSSFVAERIQEDVRTQHALLHCKSAEEFQRIQTEFVRKALDQYQAETGKLMDMSMKAFASKTGKTD